MKILKVLNVLNVLNIQMAPEGIQIFNVFLSIVAVLWPAKKETTTTTNRKRNTLFAAKLIRAAEHHVPY